MFLYKRYILALVFFYYIKSREIRNRQAFANDRIFFVYEANVEIKLYNFISRPIDCWDI